MRLLWIANYGGLYPGSIIPLLLATLGAARDKGWEVGAVLGPVARYRPWLKGLEAQGIPIRFAPAGRAAATRWLQREVLAPGPAATVLHTHFSRFDSSAAQASLWARRPRPCVFWHVHTALAASPAARIRNLARFGILGRTVDGIFTPSEDLREQIVRRGAPAGRTHAVPNAIDAERFSLRTSAEQAAARARLGLDPDATVLLHFGWDWHRKGGDLFLHAVHRMVNHVRPDAGLVALTTQGGEPARHLARQLGLSDYVRSVGPIDDVETLHAAADVLLATSRAEGGMPPLAVAEALSRGVPVVATKIPDHAYAAEHTRACRLTSDDPGSIARAVIETLDRPPSQAQTEARQSHAWIRQERGLEPWVTRVLQFYEQALERRGHGVAGSGPPNQRRSGPPRVRRRQWRQPTVQVDP